MKKTIFTIEENTPVAADTFRLRLKGDCSAVTMPGQFVEIALPELFLRRPISVSQCKGGELTLICRAVGKGTEMLRKMRPGQELEILGGLGRGFLPEGAETPADVLLVGGGVGTAPLIWLAEELVKRGCRVTAALGFRSAGEVFGVSELKEAGAEVRLATEDGSVGKKGFVTGLLEGLSPGLVCACGPSPMLRALHKALPAEVPGRFSLEERMGCGYGACVGCTIMTAGGPRRVCKDGPVFDRRELLWE